MRVLIVDDSPVLRQLLRAVMESDGCEVVEAEDGAAALRVLATWQPDVVSMDVHMPGMNGYETTTRILERYPIPVVVVTASADVHASETAIRALSAGALAVVEKPCGPWSRAFDTTTADLLRVLHSMAGVKVMRRLPGTPPATSDRLAWQGEAEVVAIGASAGGPVALKALFQELRADCPWPVLLVQHIAPGFMPSFRDWLAQVTPLQVKIAEDGEALRPATLYLAPDAVHLGVSRQRRIQLDAGERCEGMRPAVNYLFDRLADHLGGRVIAALLSGMGRDGAQALARLKTLGALTLVQDPLTALVDGMPRAAIASGGAGRVLAPEAMAALLNTLGTAQAVRR